MSENQLISAVIEAAIEKVRAQTYEPIRMDPIHPDDYTFIQRALGTTEPLTQHQVLDWAWSKVLETDPFLPNCMDCGTRTVASGGDYVCPGCGHSMGSA